MEEGQFVAIGEERIVVHDSLSKFSDGGGGADDQIAEGDVGLVIVDLDRFDVAFGDLVGTDDGHSGVALFLGDGETDAIGVDSDERVPVAEAGKHFGEALSGSLAESGVDGGHVRPADAAYHLGRRLG